MGNLSKIKVVSVSFLLLVISMNSCIGLEGDENMMMSNQEQREAAESETPIIDAAKRLFSLPTASEADSWIFKVKALFQRGWPYVSPPNLDFRGGGGRDEGMTGKDEATERVKEAVVKSLDTSKATVEDSAKSAAEYAEDAVDKTVKKLKKTLSNKGQQEAEL